MSSSGRLGTTALVVSWVFAGLATTVVATRYYVRLKMIRRFTIDDALIFLALALEITNSVFLTISAHWGLGAHMDELSKYQVMYTMKWVYLGGFFSILSPCVGRIAYASLLLSLLPPIPWRSRLLWTMIWVQFVVDIGAVIIISFRCRSIKMNWDPSVFGQCWSPIVQQSAGYIHGSVCCAVDLVLAFFPASMFWNLNMEWKRKLSLSCLMGLGIFAMVVSVVRTVQLKAIGSDLTYDMANLSIWWTLEAYLVILAASIPTLRPILPSSLSRTPDNGARLGHPIHLFRFRRGHSGAVEGMDEHRPLNNENGSQPRWHRMAFSSLHGS
ncbi:hypothetical protein BJX99DRAFT_271289 [Aspergillus californicus]